MNDNDGFQLWLVSVSAVALLALAGWYDSEQKIRYKDGIIEGIERSQNQSIPQINVNQTNNNHPGGK
jgi:hypothetical protein